MSEILNNPFKNGLNIETTITKTVNNVVVPQKHEEEAVLPQGDEKDISVRESKNTKTTNINFIDDENTEINVSINTNGINLGLNLKVNVSLEETKALLSMGNKMIKSGNVDFSGGASRIKDNPVASIIFGFAMLAASQQMETESLELRKEMVKPKLQIFEKMTHNDTKITDFSHEEKAFLWKNTGIEVKENNEGKVEYLYYETPGSIPKKLTEEEIQQVYLHMLNIINNDDLFMIMMEAGNDLNQLYKTVNTDSSVEEKAKKTEKKENKYNKKFQVENNIPFLNQLKSIDKEDKSNSKYSAENTYLSKSAEMRQEEANYHNKKLKQIDQERLNVLAEEKKNHAMEDIKTLKKQEEILNKDKH